MKEQTEKIFRAIGDVGDDLIAQADAPVIKAPRVWVKWAALAACCALVIGAGSRDERPDEYGLAHCTEHAFFKGTQRRRAWQVNCRLENLGGELNAFTTKEDTTIHATTLKGDFAKAAELIADIAFRSTFPDREL